ncbi:MAG: hypothetical protein JRI59_12045 [Deltaproteobacteria bacterium]|nr:hypothetical protein [Deltaproteobacteria bacterium]
MAEIDYTQIVKDLKEIESAGEALMMMAKIKGSFKGIGDEDIVQIATDQLFDFGCYISARAEVVRDALNEAAQGKKAPQGGEPEPRPEKKSEPEEDAPNFAPGSHQAPGLSIFLVDILPICIIKNINVFLKGRWG